MGYTILGIVLVVFGIYMIFVFIRHLISRAKLIKAGGHTNATIVEIKHMPGARGSVVYHPVLNYIIDGVEYTVFYHFGSVRQKSYIIKIIPRI